MTIDTDPAAASLGGQPEGDPPTRINVGEASLRSARWIALGRIFVETFQLGSTVILARLLAPSDFGKFAVAAIAYSFASGVPVNGLGGPIVRAKVLRHELIRTVETLSLAFGLLATGLVILTSRLVIGSVGHATADLIALMAPSFLLTSLSTAPQALLQREFDFRRLAIIEVISVLVGIVTSISLAAAEVGASSMVIGLLANAATTTALAFLWAPALRPGFDRRCAKQIVTFGLPASASVMAWMAARNVDYAVLGSRLQPATVGLYWRSYQLAAEYQGKVSLVLTRIAFPAFSQTSSHDELRALRARVVKLHTVALFPLLAMLAALAPVLVPAVYGDRWAAAVVPTQILTIVGACMAISAGTEALILALGRPRANLFSNLVVLAGVGAAVWFSAPHGLIAICWTISVTRVAMTLMQQYFLVDRIAGIRLLDTLRSDVVPAGLCCAVLMGVAWPAQELLRWGGAPAAANLALSGTLGTLAYLTSLRIVFPDAARDLRTLVARVLPSFRRRSELRPSDSS